MREHGFQALRRAKKPSKRPASGKKAKKAIRSFEKAPLPKERQIRAK
jgi:hypothetical protein